MDSVTLGLPSTVLVRRAMPKKVFYEHLAATAAVKDEFVRLIERIEMIAALKESTAHVPANDQVIEIDVLGLYLRSEKGHAAVPRAAVELIARSVPNKVLFACIAGDSLKLLVRYDRLYETEWLPGDAAVELRGNSLEELWCSLLAQVVFGDGEPAGFEGRIEHKNRIEALQKELVSVQRKRKSEKQIAKRNALFDRMRAIKQELAQLESGE